MQMVLLFSRHVGNMGLRLYEYPDTGEETTDAIE